MPIVRLSTSFSKYKDLELDQKAQIVLSGLTNNAAFPTPTPPLTDLQTTLETYQQALVAAQDGGKLSVSAKNEARDTLEDVLSRLAFYVQLMGKNNETVMLSSGFDLTKSRTPVGTLDKPENFKVEPGPTPGSVKLSVKRVKGAIGYLFEYTTAPVADDSVWTDVISSRSSVIIEGLTSGKQYVFRAAGVGSDPTRVYSDAVSSFVL